jgi:VanZ family protein
MVCSVIFYLSSLSGLKSDFVPVVDVILRKLAHIYEYLVLYLTAVFAFYDRQVADFEGEDGYMGGVLWAAFVFCVLFAIGDETHQLFVSDRSGRIVDLLYDAIGIYFGYILVLAVLYMRRGQVVSTKQEYETKKFSV